MVIQSKLIMTSIKIPKRIREEIIWYLDHNTNPDNFGEDWEEPENFDGMLEALKLLSDRNKKGYMVRIFKFDDSNAHIVQAIGVALDDIDNRDIDPALRRMLNQLKVDLLMSIPISKEELDNIVTSGGKAYDFKIGGKYYIENENWLEDIGYKGKGDTEKDIAEIIHYIVAVVSATQEAGKSRKATVDGLSGQLTIGDRVISDAEIEAAIDGAINSGKIVERELTEEQHNLLVAASVIDEYVDDESVPDVVKVRVRLTDDELTNEQLIQRLKAEGGYEKQAMYGIFAKRRHLKPDIDAKEFNEIWDRVTPYLYVKSMDVEYVPTHRYIDPEMRGATIMVTGTTEHSIEHVSNFGSTGGTPKLSFDEMFEPIDGEVVIEEDVVDDDVDWRDKAMDELEKRGTAKHGDVAVKIVAFPGSDDTDEFGVQVEVAISGDAGYHRYYPSDLGQEPMSLWKAKIKAAWYLEHPEAIVGGGDDLQRPLFDIWADAKRGNVVYITGKQLDEMIDYFSERDDNEARMFFKLFTTIPHPEKTTDVSAFIGWVEMDPKYESLLPNWNDNISDRVTKMRHNIFDSGASSLADVIKEGISLPQDFVALYIAAKELKEQNAIKMIEDKMLTWWNKFIFTLYDDEYSGPRWTYGLRYRPPSVGAVPKAGQIPDSYSKEPYGEYRYGTLSYARPLTEYEIKNFELDLIGES